MSNTNGTNSLARSLNVIITYDDGSGTVTENGTIITNNLALNTISAEYPTKYCNIWETNTGVTNYSSWATGTINVGNGSTGNVNIGPIAGTVSGGAINIGISTRLSGAITIGSASATNGKIRLNSPLVECAVAPSRVIVQ